MNTLEAFDACNSRKTVMYDGERYEIERVDAGGSIPGEGIAVLIPISSRFSVRVEELEKL